MKEFSGCLNFQMLAGTSRRARFIVPTKQVFFARNDVPCFIEAKKLLRVIFLPLFIKGPSNCITTYSYKLLVLRTMKKFSQKEEPIQNIVTFWVSYQPELYSKFVWFVCQVLGERTSCLCWEELLINCCICTRFITGLANFNESVPYDGKNNKFICRCSFTPAGSHIKL